jgi:hypothetical protein
MAEIRKLITEGHNHTQIRSWLNIPESTYFTYLKQTFKQDRETLHAKNKEDVLTAYVILKDRLSQLYVEAYKIINADNNSSSIVSAADRLDAIRVAADLSVGILKLQLESPMALYLNTPPEQRGKLILTSTRRGESGSNSSSNSSSKVIALTQQEQEAQVLEREKQEALHRQKKALFIPPRRLDSDEIEQKARELEELRRRKQQEASTSSGYSGEGDGNEEQEHEEGENDDDDE